MHRLSASTLIALLILCPARADEIEARLQALVQEHPKALTLHQIGHSLENRPIHLVRIALPGDTDPDHRPALLVVAGLDGRHPLGPRLALASIEHLLADEKSAEQLVRRTVYVVPVASPDAAISGRAGNDRSIDHDRDGRPGEDPPKDLDGDGHALWMLVPDPTGQYLKDPEEPRLVRKRDPTAGERGTFRLLPEGIDQDEDGEIAEDGPQGVEIDRNFPHRFTMHRDGAGRYATSEPETRALTDFLIERGNIAAVLCFGLEDNLTKVPEAGSTKPRQPATKLDPADRPLFEEVARFYRERTGIKGKPRPTPGGTFSEWAYFHRGLPSFAARGWYEPSAPDSSGNPGPDEEKKSPDNENHDDRQDPDENQSRTADEALKNRNRDGLRKRKPDQPRDEKKDDSEDARRLALADKLERGFVQWKEFEHPTLGPVEIGGFIDGFEFSPPEEDAKQATESHAPFAAHLLGLLPDVRLADVSAEPLADGLYRIQASVVNHGRMPLVTAQGRRAQQPGPVVIRLTGRYTLRGGRPDGRPVLVLWDLPGGGRTELEWIVQDPVDLVVQMSSHRGFSAQQEVDLP